MILYTLDLFGVAIFAVSGALMAARKELDLLGVIVAATVTAIGGGTLRDLLLDRNPIFWIADPTYPTVILVAALLTLFYTRHARVPERALLVADAGGLALFTLSGASIAAQLGLPALSVVLMGTMTGCAGGLLRDVLCNEVPLILRRDVYATAAIAGAGSYLLAQRLGVDDLVAVLLGMAVVIVLRIMAIYRGLHLPVFPLHDHPPDDHSESDRQ
jgi:uncharacterized membrane protein YeiH